MSPVPLSLISSCPWPPAHLPTPRHSTPSSFGLASQWFSLRNLEVHREEGGGGATASKRGWPLSTRRGCYRGIGTHRPLEGVGVDARRTRRRRAGRGRGVRQ